MAAAAALVAPSSQPRPLDRRGIGFLVAAHAFNDMNQSIVPAILPFLIAQRHLSYAAAASLVLSLTIASSVIQPLFGYITDKRSIPWLIPAALLCGMSGTVLLGFAPTFTWLLGATLIAGVGSAAFHPEAARAANALSGSQRATGMGFFGLGGNIGFAAGPILVTPAILLIGLHGTGLIMVPGVLYALFFAFVEMRRFASLREAPKKFKSASERGDRWGAFALLTTTIVMRSVVFFGVMTFTPLFCIAVLGATKAQANAVLAMTLIAAAAGVITGGRLGDRVDRRKLIMISMSAAAAFTAVIAWAAGSGASLVEIALLFIALGFLMQLSQSVTIVLGQDYLPTRIGTASGVTLGLAISMGGFAMPFLGRLGDTHGLTPVLFAIGGFALAALIAASFLPPISKAKNDNRSTSVVDEESRNVADRLGTDPAAVPGA
ncbi:MAG TPA: MFS transporter [Candidatus Baltobacteraceae bacterium]|jgi:FSR family fosmidomycin resistance protein-like MFS transporter